jgi:hypothetical protein
MSSRVRLNLMIMPAVKARIERLQELSGAGSITAVITSALAHYEVRGERGDRVLVIQ